MIDTVIYTMVSHACNLLEEHSEALRRLFPTARLVLVQDGGYPCKPALRADHVTIHLRPNDPSPIYRAEALANGIISKLGNEQSERYMLILHADMFLQGVLSGESLMKGKRYAVAGRPHMDGTMRWHTQLLAADLGHGKVGSWRHWEIKDCCVWPVINYIDNDKQRRERIGEHWLHLTWAGQGNWPPPFKPIPVPMDTDLRVLVHDSIVSIGRRTIRPSKVRITKLRNKTRPVAEAKKNPSDQKDTAGTAAESHFVSSKEIESRKRCCEQCPKLRHSKYGQPYCLANCKREGKICQRVAVGKYSVAMLKPDPWCDPWRQLYPTQQPKDNPAE